MAFSGNKIEDILKQQKKSREERIANMQDKVTAAKLPQNFRPGISLNHIEDNYKPEEILFRKIVNPYEIIKSNIPDPEKFQKDYNNLKSNPNDIGFTMNKNSLMDNKVLLVVVTDKAMKRFNPNAAGYAGEMSTTEDPDTNIRTIFLPKSAVKEIKDGEITLTDEGEQTFRHEARHTAQEGDPGERHQGSMSKFEKEWFKHYMNDPKEIGVRLGELKNHLSDETLLKLTNGNTTHYNNMKEILKDVSKPGKEKEKELLKLFMGSIKYKNTTTKKEKFKGGLEGNEETFLKLMSQQSVNPKDNTIKYVKEKLANSNEDMKTLFNHYDELSDVEKRILMQELLDNYDNVVKNDTKTPNTNPIT
jgi:hypothetical protein